jgi:hypothetical protein
MKEGVMIPQEYPYEVKSVQRGETHDQEKGWSNTFIVRVNKQTGHTWILTHVGNDLIWVMVPEPATAPSKG